MSQIFLSPQQTEMLANSSDPVILCDPSGNVVGYVNREVGFTEEDINEARRRITSNEPGRTSEQVMERLRSLENK
jgi:hypothetical protein